MIKIMISNGTVFFSFLGLVVFLIAYKLAPFLNYEFDANLNNQYVRVGNLSVVDKLFHSTHSYELKDCFVVDVRCRCDDECRAVCTEKLPWYCENHVCKLRDSTKPTASCVNGDMKTVYDFKTKLTKTICRCKSPLYYGDNCSKIVPHCDAIKKDDLRCLCKKGSVNFLWYIGGGAYDICVPNIHSKLFMHQDNFELR